MLLNNVRFVPGKKKGCNKPENQCNISIKLINYPDFLIITYFSEFSLILPLMTGTKHHSRF